MKRLNIISLLSIALCFLAINANEYKIHKNFKNEQIYNLNDDTISFHSLFTHIRSIPIEGTSDHPVFNVTDVAVRESLVVVLERKSARLTAFNVRGEVQYQVGEPGGAPGEFSNPYWVGFDANGRLAVLEGPGNSRIQFLEPETGQSLDVLTDGIRVQPFCDDVHFYENESGDHRVMFPTQAPCTSEKTGLCVIHKHSVSSDTTIERFAKRENVRKNAIGVPWIMEYSNNDQIYISHIRGGSVRVYNKYGEYIKSIDISKADVFLELDNSQFSSQYDGQTVQKMLDKKYSRVWNLSVVDDEIVVYHFGKTKEDQSFRMSIFGKENGRYLASTPTWERGKRKLVTVQDDRFFFLEADRSSDVGSYDLHEYRFDGARK